MSLAKPTPYGNAEDLAFINRSLVAQLKRERAALQRVRDLHHPWGDTLTGFRFCNECDRAWPCATVRALDGDE